MRRIVMVMALVALLVAVFASAALARNFQCSERPCFGTNRDDVILERGGEGVADTIYGRAGRDVIKAQHFGDGAHPQLPYLHEPPPKTSTNTGGYTLDKVERIVRIGYFAVTWELPTGSFQANFREHHI